MNPISEIKTVSESDGPFAPLPPIKQDPTPQTCEPRPFPDGFVRVQGRCPACRLSALFLGDGGYITCGNLQCTDPCAATDMLEAT